MSFFDDLGDVFIGGLSRAVDAEFPTNPVSDAANQDELAQYQAPVPGAVAVKLGTVGETAPTSMTGAPVAAMNINTQTMLIGGAVVIAAVILAKSL